MHQNPDFELYDNVGRDADQIAAARYGIATRGDLLRWARRDAKPFQAEHPLPDKPLPSPDLAPYLAALAAAPKLLMEAASRSLSVAAIADEADLTTLRATYDPAPTPDLPPGQARASTELPPAPPHAPPAGPTPDR